jgi:hypothetical protein
MVKRFVVSAPSRSQTIRLPPPDEAFDFGVSEPEASPPNAEWGSRGPHERRAGVPSARFPARWGGRRGGAAGAAAPRVRNDVRLQRYRATGVRYSVGRCLNGR